MASFEIPESLWRARNLFLSAIVLLPLLLVPLSLCLGAKSVPKFLGDVHTSAAFIAPLALVEDRVVEKLKELVAAEGIEGNLINKYIEDWESSSTIDYASHPINSYHFFKRLVYDYHEVEKVTGGFEHVVALSEIRKLKGSLHQPTDEDIKGVAWAIARLQELYDLSIEDLVNGTVRGAVAIKGLDVDDCLKLSQQSFENLAFEVSELWTKKAIELLRKSRPFKKEHAERIKESLELIKKRSVMQELVTTMAKTTGETLKGKLSGLGIPKSFEKEVFKHKDKTGQLDLMENIFKSLCSEKKFEDVGEISQPLHHCFLSFGEPIRIHYAPFMIESVFSNPDMMIFHGIISDHEINQLQTLSYPQLENARVKPYSNDAVKKSIARIGKSAWLKRTNYTLVDTLLKRIEVMTGLTTKYANELHVLNYGIGGHYELHIDFFDFQNRVKVEDESALKGDQILTVLFYLNDVVAGGSTVFPYINVGVKPEKGSAVVWRNLYRNGRGNYRTLHASCPVLLGQKWITTLWLNEYGQEFRSPCSLDPDE